MSSRLAPEALLAVLAPRTPSFNPAFSGAAGLEHSREPFAALLNRHVRRSAVGTATMVGYGALEGTNAGLCRPDRSSPPNVYFHALTVQDILHWKGAHIGKLDFIGKMRLEPRA